VVSGLSITRQFSLLGVIGLAITLVTVWLSFSTTYDVALQAKEAQVRALVEAGVTLTDRYVQLAQAGKMTTADAQREALLTLGSARFDNGNYYYVIDYAGITLLHPERKLVGNAIIFHLKDPHGTIVGEPLVTAAEAGHPIFHKYYFPEAGQTVPLPKITYGAAVPEWGWVIASGLYIDDLRPAVLADFTPLAEIILALAAFYILVILLLRSGISRLLGAMTHSMERIATGAFETPIPAQTRRDELGRMAKALQFFRDAAVEKAKLEREADAARALAAEERAQTGAQQADTARRQDVMVASVAQGLQRLSAGDLRFRLGTPFSPEYDTLRRDFNATMDKLQQTITAITGTAKAVRSGAGEINEASDDLSRRTEQQAAGLEETAATLDQITVAVRTSADGAEEAHRLISAAKADAETSGTVAQETLRAMNGLSASAQQISSIVGLIDEIAFQTNLLALNAGVEAARAGDAGRGFAVVATEVRALAQRSADAAKEIKALISSSGQQVATGVTLVGETARALGRIGEQVGQLNALVTGIASSARDQATGLGQVNTALTQMDKVTQQNAAMVAETTAASRSLVTEAEHLAGLIARFAADEAPASNPRMPAVRRLAKV
jgi:methyl-accepting chemotaxis protein